MSCAMDCSLLVDSSSVAVCIHYTRQEFLKYTVSAFRKRIGNSEKLFLCKPFTIVRYCRGCVVERAACFDLENCNILPFIPPPCRTSRDLCALFSGFIHISFTKANIGAYVKERKLIRRSATRLLLVHVSHRPSSTRLNRSLWL